MVSGYLLPHTGFTGGFGLDKVLVWYFASLIFFLDIIAKAFSLVVLLFVSFSALF